MSPDNREALRQLDRDATSLIDTIKSVELVINDPVFVQHLVAQISNIEASVGSKLRETEEKEPKREPWPFSVHPGSGDGENGA